MNRPNLLLATVGALMFAACGDLPDDDIANVEQGMYAGSDAPACTNETATITVTGSTSTPMPCSWTSTLNDRVYMVTVNANIVYLDANGVQQTTPYSNSQTVDAGPGAGNGFSFTFQAPVCGTIQSVSASARVQVVLMYGIHGTMQLTYDGSGTGQPNSVSFSTDRTGATCVTPGATQCFGLCPNNLDNSPPPPPQQIPAPPPPQCNFPQTSHYGQTQQNCCLACVAAGAQGMNFWASYACQYLGYCTGSNSSCSCQ